MNFDIWTQQVGRNKEAPRVFLAGAKVSRGGFDPGLKYEAIQKDDSLVLVVKPDGTRVVSKKMHGGREIPVIDLNSNKLLDIFDDMDEVRIVVRQGELHILPLASAKRKMERLNRIKDKLRRNEPLAMGSLSHGGGVLSHAIHTGLTESNVPTKLAVANEIRDDLIAQAIDHNDTWTTETRALNAPIQELVQDEWTMDRLPKLEIVEMGLPCSGASSAGKAKRAITLMEDHPEVGGLIFPALVFITKTNPAVIICENVPNYASTGSAAILRRQLHSMRYNVVETILEGSAFGSLEDRQRWCLVATTGDIEFTFDNIAPLLNAVKTVADILEDVSPDDPTWREVTYLKDKQERDKLAGKGFAMQYVLPTHTRVPTLRKGYAKGGSTDPRLAHPTDPSRSRLFTAREHAAIKEIPASLIEGQSDTIAHQLLGQSVVYAPFRAVGRRLGEALRKAS